MYGINIGGVGCESYYELARTVTSQSSPSVIPCPWTADDWKIAHWRLRISVSPRPCETSAAVIA